MEQKPIDLEKAVTDFATQLRQYGYRNSFKISLPGKNDYLGNLNDCLNRYLAANTKVESYPMFELRTKAPYNTAIQCRFKIEFGMHEGFNIKTVWIKNLKTDVEHEFRLRSNREMPGAQTLEGMFPKPKPWDFLKKGKRRP
ncbi:hypothetical protein [Sphingobacterium sp. UME9]|uniref:hypothetical protein n=1 Tax=Sphingobacterium TaxID=28453 RepID=UPI001601D6B2|nr:hypothetical protein [Sphingobacterium sp. UME9]MBB1642771.1 hypothetical protein [Sphingobacterium sp. UME9]